MQVFWAKGFAATAIADLEHATGLGRQSLYGAFGDKRALYEAVVDFYWQRVLKPGLIDVLDAEGSPRANVERIVRGWEEMVDAEDFNGCLLGNCSSALRPDEAELAELLRHKLKLMEDAFARTIRRAQRQGEVRAELDARATARSLLAIAQGLAVLGRVQRDRSYVRGVVESALRLLD